MAEAEAKVIYLIYHENMQTLSPVVAFYKSLYLFYKLILVLVFNLLLL